MYGTISRKLLTIFLINFPLAIIYYDPLYVFFSLLYLDHVSLKLRLGYDLLNNKLAFFNPCFVMFNYFYWPRGDSEEGKIHQSIKDKVQLSGLRDLLNPWTNFFRRKSTHIDLRIFEKHKILWNLQYLPASKKYPLPHLWPLHFYDRSPLYMARCVYRKEELFVNFV